MNAMFRARFDHRPVLKRARVRTDRLRMRFLDQFVDRGIDVLRIEVVALRNLLGQGLVGFDVPDDVNIAALEVVAEEPKHMVVVESDDSEFEGFRVLLAGRSLGMKYRGPKQECRGQQNRR